MNWQAQFANRMQLTHRSPVRELLKVLSRPGMVSFAGGIPAPELFPIEAVERSVTRVLKRNGRAALQYGETEGLAELRDWIAARFSRPSFEVRCENVMIVTGSQQALDLLGKVFLNPGDRVLVENPTYLAMLSAWRPLQPHFVPVASDSDGMVVDTVPRLLGAGVKMVYLVPDFQNPQGTTLSLERRRQLLEYASGETIIVEDNPYGELRYEGEALPSLLELEGNLSSGGVGSRVIQLGTFSKVLAPGLRVGWVIAPSEVIEKLVQAKQAADLHTSTLCQHIVLELVRDGLLDRHIPVLREAYKLRRDTMLSALSAHFPSELTWTHPKGGMFLLVNLKNRIRAAALLERALLNNVAFVPGDDFHLDGSGQHTLRLNFSNASPAEIEEGIRRLAEVIRVWQ